MKRYIVLRWFGIAILLAARAWRPAFAEVTLPALFGPGMVPQRDAKLPIWGWDKPGDQITISLAGQQVHAVAGTVGHWQAAFEPLQAGGPFTLNEQGSSTIALQNVMVGEVWLVTGCPDTLGILPASAAPAPASSRIRVFSVPYQLAEWAKNRGWRETGGRMQPIDIWPVDDPSLPRVLTMGDSIHSGYKDEVKRLLAGRANVVSVTTPVNVKMTLAGSRPIWGLRPGDYAVLHVNHGLHGDASVPEAEYEQQLATYWDLLKHAMGDGKIIWATTTPIRSKKAGENLDPEKNPGILRINSVARRLAPLYGIVIDDFYPLVAGRMERLAVGKGNVHLGDEGRHILATAAADAISRALDQSPGRSRHP